MAPRARRLARLARTVIGPVLAVVLPCNPQLLAHSLLDYISFLTLLGALFIISGGIHITGEFAGTPLVNTIFLGIGALLANVIGTTGASMLLVRPLIRANHMRQHKSHLIVFFIFVVSNYIIFFFQYIFNLIFSGIWRCKSCSTNIS